MNKPDLDCVSDVQLPSANGQLRAANQKTVTQLQRSMIDLCRIIEKILRSLYETNISTISWLLLIQLRWSPKPLLHCHQRAAFFDSTLLELKTWYYDLPSELKVDRPSGPSRFPHAYTLSMVYHQAVILLCCPFVTVNAQSPTPPKGETVQHSPQSNDKQQPNSRYAKGLSSCSNSIRVMCCIAQRYRQTFGSFKLSPITATHCTLSTALMLIELCCAAKPVAKHSPTDDGPQPHRLPPHAAVALCFQVLRELSTSWNIAKRIGRNLERVYIQRYGSEHLAFMPKDGEGNGQVLVQEPKSTSAGKFTIPNLEMFDDILNARPFLAEDPTQAGLEIPVTFDQLPNFSRPGIPAMALHSPGDIQNFPNQDEIFGYAFSLDSLPSDYNMFDTLNQMYLEESW